MSMDTRPDFTGDWVFNREKSVMESPAPDSSLFVIRQKDGLFRLERTHSIAGHRDSLTMELPVDGTPVEITHHGVAITAKAYFEGQELVFDSTFRQDDETALNLVRYRLADSGNVLIADEKFKSAEHDHHNRWFFDRRQDA